MNRLRILAATVLLVLSVAACVMTPEERVDKNVRASHTAQENLANGLPDEVVWCWEPTDRNLFSTNETVTPYKVPSRVMARAGFDCDVVTLFNTDGYSCDETFCYIYGYQPSQIIPVTPVLYA